VSISSITFNFYCILMREDLELYLDAVDKSDSRDYLYADYMHEYATGKLWPIRDTLINKIYDQFDQSSTYKACTCYWLWIINNWNNLAEYWSKWFDYEQQDPKWLRHTFQSTRWYPNKWSSLQEMMRFYKKMWLIDWYMRANTIEECKHAIDNGFLIYTWTKSCNWRETSKKKAFVYKKNWWWHCFSIVWYNDKWFIAANSFGTDRWDAWYFTIPYDDYKYLYSKYVIIDKDDTWTLKNLEYQREFQKAIELWITNWDRPNDKASRKEVAVMIYRLYKKLI